MQRRRPPVEDRPVGPGDLGDEHRVGVHAVGGEGGVRRRHVEDADLVASQHRRRVRLERPGDPQPVGHVDGLLRPDLLDQLGVDRVDGMDGGVDEVDRRPALALVVVDHPRLLPGGHGDGERRRRLVHLLRRDALGQRLGQHERLERRPRLAHPLGGQVELGLRFGAEEVPAAHQRPHEPRLRIEHHHGARRVGGRVGQHGLHRLLSRLLDRQVDRGVDAQPVLEQQPAPVGRRGAETGVVEDEPLDPLHEVAGRVAGVGRLGHHP